MNCVAAHNTGLLNQLDFKMWKQSLLCKSMENKQRILTHGQHTTGELYFSIDAYQVQV